MTPPTYSVRIVSELKPKFMNRFAVLIIAAIQVMTLHAVTNAQSESPSTVATAPCIPQGAAIAKGESRLPCPPTHKNTRGFAIQFIGLNVLSQTEAMGILLGDSVVSPDKALDTEKAASVLKEALASRGYPNARVQAYSDGQTTLTLFVDEGSRVRLAAIQFQGNRIFPEHELRATNW